MYMYLLPYAKIKSMFISHNECQYSHEHKREESIEPKDKAIAAIVYCTG